MSTAASAAGEGLREPFGRGLPFSLKVLICFLLVDAFEKTLLLGVTFGAGYPLLDRATLIDRYLPHLLVFTFDLLLAFEISRKTQAGRIWGMIYLAAVTLLGLFLLVVEPERWLDLSSTGRVRAIASQCLHMLFFAILASRRTARILNR